MRGTGPPRFPYGKRCRLAFATAGVSLLIAGSAEAASGNRSFATRIAAGPVSVSCKAVRGTAPRVRIAAQIGYSDVARRLEARLTGRRHRGSVTLKLTTRAGRTLARTSDTDALELGFDRDRIHHTHVALLGRRAARRVLRYAHGTARCPKRPKHHHRVEVVMRARQRLSASRGRAGVRRLLPALGQAAGLHARADVVAGSVAQGSTCPPYACLGTVAALSAWAPSDARPFDIASVPLAGRVASSGPRMLIGLDNGPWAFWSDFDLNAQGSELTGNVYNFSHWQYVDSLYYYLHQLVSVPPTAWVNAAHRNGVTVLGSVRRL